MSKSSIKVPANIVRAVGMTASGDTTRPLLQCLAIQQYCNGLANVVATDSYRVAWARIEADTSNLPDELLVPPELFGAVKSTDFSVTFSILDNGLTVTAAIEDKRGLVRTLSAQALTGPYVKWEQVVYRAHSVQQTGEGILLDAKYLGEFCKAAAIANPGQNPVKVALSIVDGHKPAELCAGCLNAIIMPIRG